MTKNKTLFVFLFFLVQVFYLNVNGESIKVEEKINSNEKSKKNYLPITNIKGNLFFTLGALSNSSSSESLQFTYENKIRLISSFNGTDKLLTVIESGNASNSNLMLDLQSNSYMLHYVLESSLLFK